jgi:hypothetical protein
MRGSIVAFQQAIFNLAAVPILVVVGLVADHLGIPYALLAVAIVVLAAARIYVREKPGPAAQIDTPAPAVEPSDSLAH